MSTIDYSPGSVVRGMRLRLYPKPAQAATFDLWRRRTRELWNLLIGIEQAAYSGEKHKPHLGWREIWADVARINYELAIERRERRIAEGEEPGREPKAPDIAAIMARGLKGEPKLFIWENDLQKLMARLKTVPWTRWVADLPSHAAQRVVKEVVKALQNMIKEKKKRAAGAGDRVVGFPRFRANRYAEGSVYFANTQLQWDRERRRIRFPGGVGWIAYEDTGRHHGISPGSRFMGGRAIARRAHKAKPGRIQAGMKLMGARLWRQGEDWWLSPQFEMPAPAALPLTGRAVGVKVAAGTLATVYDGRSFEETMTPKRDPFAERRMRLWGRKLSRRLDAQTERLYKIRRRGKVGTQIRVPRSHGFIEASAELAKRNAHEAAQRNDLLHKTSRRIVNTADSITIERLDVAGMARKADHKAEKRRRRREKRLNAAGGDVPVRHRAPAKVLRRAVRRAAMARLLTYIKYKAEDGARTVTETHVLFPRVQACAAKLPDGTTCGHLNMMMKDGRIRHQCGKCGAVMHRNLNAAENIEKSGKASRDSMLDAAE